MSSTRGGILTALVVLTLAGARCSSRHQAGRPLGLYVPIGSYDFHGNPDLLESILASPYGYFRFINQRFAQSLCVRFADDLAAMPKVNLHGDCHVGQYSVTESGRGLADFDDASTGPAILDLVRVGVSIELVADEKRWSDEKSFLVEEFLRGYRAALEDPDTIAPQPRVVDRIRAQFGSDRRPLLAWADALMDPGRLPPAPVQRLIRPFAEGILEQNPDLPPNYFQVKKAGRHRLGVGSALDEKYLLRVEGPTAAGEDDVLLEIKEIRDLSAIECIERETRDALPILAAQSRIAYQPYRFTGFLHLEADEADNRGLGSNFLGGTSFWFHTWVDHYYEISMEDLQSPQELAEIVFDMGVQLGRGHPKDVTPDDSKLRRAQLESLNSYEAELKRTIEDLAEETVAAWETFRTEASAPARH